MRSRVDDRLKAEAAKFRLRFSCEDCAHFDPDAGDAAAPLGDRGACSQGFPAFEHRGRSLEGRTDVVFCKMFEAS